MKTLGLLLLIVFVGAVSSLRCYDEDMEIDECSSMADACLVRINGGLQSLSELTP